MSFGACVWYFYSLSRVTPATSHLDALDKDTKLKIVELWMFRERCERFSIKWYVLEFCFGLSRQMFSFGGRPAVINYIWRGPGSQNSVFGKLQGYRHQIRQFVVEIRRWKSELPIPELPGPNGGNFELGNPRSSQCHLGKPSFKKSAVFFNIAQMEGGGGQTHVQKLCRKLSCVLEVI